MKDEWKAEAERLLFDFGKRVLGQNSGGLITKLMQLRGISGARLVLKMAAEKSDPREYVGAALREKKADAPQVGEIWGHGKWARRWTGSRWAEVE